MARPPVTRANPYTPKRGALAGQTFRSERQYRNALARLKGYPSWHAQQRAPRVVRTAAELGKLDPSERLAHRQAFDALDLMRDGVSLSRAAKRVGTTPNTVLRHVRPALERSAGGRWRAKRGDRLYRRMQLHGPDGIEAIDVRNSRDASEVGEYMSAVSHFIATGDASRLHKFEGKSKGGVPYQTDLAVLRERARRGELPVEDVYELAA